MSYVILLIAIHFTRTQIRLKVAKYWTAYISLFGLIMIAFVAPSAMAATPYVPHFPDPDREVALDFHSSARRAHSFGSRRNRAKCSHDRMFQAAFSLLEMVFPLGPAKKTFLFFAEV